ncbi:clostripain-related cysteine peptidase [Chloroflexus sp. MS-G]|uniref:clostripain-related cysteine peptidase n=1 Tax=Chloroflexus sp. MS-G TaxID=1521187 RepID=UPI00068A8438|nr:clostripain-related cysteine peptidase [Chloroflexus sp. MS-G]
MITLAIIVSVVGLGLGNSGITSRSSADNGIAAAAPAGGVTTQQTQPYRVFQFAIGAHATVGQFNIPSDVAVAPDGTVYVADQDSHRIHRFSATGEFLGGWGVYGYSDGQFYNPRSVAVAPDGTVYVADTGNHRIQRFSASGTFLGAWGAQGYNDGQFSSPGDVAVAPDGTVYVADTGNHRIQRFSADGTFLGTWGVSGSGNGQLSSPSGIAVASDGTIYVADSGNHRIQRFSASGTFLTTWMAYGSNEVAVASDGTVYAADSWNNRILHFSATGAFLGTWGASGSGDGQFNKPSGMAVASNGTVYVADSDNRRIQQFSATGTFLGKWGAPDSSDGKFGSLSDVAVAPDGTVYVANSNRIQRFSADGTFLGAWGHSGSGNGQFSFPSGVAVAPDGTVYVADWGNHRIQRFSADGTFLSGWGSRGQSESQFSYPSDVAVASDGTVYVADSLNHRIQRFTATGTFLNAWGEYSSGNRQFNKPSEVAVAPDGTVYVADDDRIQRFDANGNLLSNWWMRAAGIAVAPDGTVYVTGGNHQILRFHTDGTILDKWGSYGSGDGQFSNPSDVAVAPDGTVYVADYYNYRIQVFGTDYPNAWRGEFFANDWLAGPVLHVENVSDLFLNRSWASQPAANIPANHFTSRWMRYVNFPTAGRYRFTIRADDGVRFWVDDRLVVESWQPQSPTREVTVELSAGYHKLLLEHWDQQGVATLALEWTRVAATPTPTIELPPTVAPPTPESGGAGQANPTAIPTPTATAIPTATPSPTATPTPTATPALPQTPTNLRQTGRTTTSITLTWQDNAVNETGFHLYRNGTRIATLGANITTYTDTGLTCGQSYRYRVSAYNTVGESAMSEELTATTADCSHFLFMLYLNGDNDLYRYVERALQALERAAANPNVLIVAVVDGPRNGDTQRLVFGATGVQREPLGELNMGNPQTLQAFVQWARERYPAQYSYLALAGHGNGLVGIGPDWNDRDDVLDAEEIRLALREATNNGQRKIDIVHYDSCSMALFEHAYEIRDYAHYLIASQYLAWSVFAYRDYAAQVSIQDATMLSGLDEVIASVSAESTPRTLATQIAERYFNHPQLTDKPRTIAVLDLGQVESVRQALDQLVILLKNEIASVQTPLKNIRQQVQTFDSRSPAYVNDPQDEYIDLYHWASLVRSLPNVSISTAAQELMDKVRTQLVVLSRRASGQYAGSAINLDQAYGVSLYYPFWSGGSGYRTYMADRMFQFTSNSQWDDFLVDYFGVTGLFGTEMEPLTLLLMLQPNDVVYVPLVVRGL